VRACRQRRRCLLLSRHGGAEQRERRCRRYSPPRRTVPPVPSRAAFFSAGYVTSRLIARPKSAPRARHAVYRVRHPNGRPVRQLRPPSAQLYADSRGCRCAEPYEERLQEGECSPQRRVEAGNTAPAIPRAARALALRDVAFRHVPSSCSSEGHSTRRGVSLPQPHEAASRRSSGHECQREEQRVLRRAVAARKCRGHAASRAACVLATHRFV